ncbi:MAG: hypothetical protein NLN66_00175 [Candidatus Thalassarchaeaceae archaeon]|nr:hypothetical protein [Candidatus Thalassarchaeaceae archaeon]
MSRIATVGIVMIMMITSLAGCTGISNGIIGSSGDEEISVPEWELGDNWLYTFSTPDYSDDTTKLVVATTDIEENGTAYMLAISSIGEARRHAVLNHNPFLGRITHDDLSPFENGMSQTVLDFPLSRNKAWSFSLFGNDWNAIVTSVDSSIASIRATANDGSSIDYIFDGNIAFFSSFIWTDSEGVIQLKMKNADNGVGHTGDVYFVRGGDLYSNNWYNTGPDAEFVDTFFVSDHPRDGEWNEMIYFLDASCGGGSTISLTLRDHTSVSALERLWGPGAEETGTLGTIPYPSEEYTLTATFTGNTHLRILLAGGITYSWNL